MSGTAEDAKKVGPRSETVAPEPDVVSLIDAVQRYLGGFADPRISPFLAAWPAKPFAIRRSKRRRLPVLSHLPGLSAETHPAAEPVVRRLEAAMVHLDWDQTYSEIEVAPGFLANYGWTELIGLRGAAASSRIACGFLLLGPHIEYPRHCHEAEEIYVPLSPGAFWVRGDEPWRQWPVGAPIHHRTWMSHGIRTGAVPLLALYIWRGGNLAQKSCFDAVEQKMQGPWK
jgi:hypothetical protein